MRTRMRICTDLQNNDLVHPELRELLKPGSAAIMLLLAFRPEGMLESEVYTPLRAAVFVTSTDLMYRFRRFLSDGRIAIASVCTTHRGVIVGGVCATYEVKMTMMESLSQFQDFGRIWWTMSMLVHLQPGIPSLPLWNNNGTMPFPKMHYTTAIKPGI